MNREVNFYRDSNQKCPTKEFLDSLSPKAAQKVTWVLKLLEDLDRVPDKFFSKMTGADQIWECRIKHGSDIYRVFAFWDNNTIVLTHGFIKKTQKTPRAEIEKAERYKSLYFNKKGELHR